MKIKDRDLELWRGRKLISALVCAMVFLICSAQRGSAALDTLAISASTTNGYAPLTVTFTAATTSSTGLPVNTWSWIFYTNTTPEIGTTNGRIVSFTFTNPGTYSANISYSPHGTPGIGNPATLTITATKRPPTVTILSPHILGTNFNFSFQTTNNQSYTIQANSNLLTTNWSAVTNFTGNGSVTNISIPLGTNKMFFRVREP